MEAEINKIRNGIQKSSRKDKFKVNFRKDTNPLGNYFKKKREQSWNEKGKITKTLKKF